MDFVLNDEQKAYRERVRNFAESCLSTDMVAGDRSCELNRDGWRRCAEFGIQGGIVPRQWGGQELELPTYVAGLEALGHFSGDLSLAFSIGAHVLGCELPLLTFGSEDQKRRWLPPLCAGEKIGAIATAEEHGASDAFNLKTTATPSADGYRLHGKKLYVTNAPLCDVALVFARLEGADGGIVCLLVESDRDGLVRSPPTAKMGLRASPFGELHFDDCRVPGENHLGRPGAGRLVFMAAMEWERGCFAAAMVGQMQRQLERTIEWTRTRSAADRPLSKHQAVSHRIAEMALRVELARLILYKYAWERSKRSRAPKTAAMAKLYITEAAAQNALDALQIFGAHGYTTASGIERDVRDALGLKIAAGTSDIQREIIARALKL